MAAARSVFVTLLTLASVGRAEGQESARDAKDPSITQRAVMDQALTAMAPDYPLEAARNGLEGRVSISTCVDTSGKPYAPKIAKSSGHDVLDQASLDWTENSVRFKPAQAGGEAVAVCNHRFAQEWKLPQGAQAEQQPALPLLRAPDGTELALTKRPKAKPTGVFRADYPASALRDRAEGEVTLQICIDMRGKVTSVEVAASSGNDALDRQSVSNLKKIAFEPGEVDGKHVAVCGVPFTVNWKLPP